MLLLGWLGELYLSKDIPIRQTSRLEFINADDVLVFDVDHNNQMTIMIVCYLRCGELISWLGIAREEKLGATLIPTLENRVFNRVVFLESLVHVKSDFEMELPTLLVNEFKFFPFLHTEPV